MIRGFLTAHYSEFGDLLQQNKWPDSPTIGKVSGKPKISAPFKKLAYYQEMLFKDDHLPPGFIFFDDPSHMKQEAAKEFLDFIHKCQVLHSQDIFGFEYWLDSNGGLEDPAETLQDSGISHKKKQSHWKAMAKKRKQAVADELDDGESYVEDPNAEGSETETSDNDEPEANTSMERNEAKQLPTGSKGKGKQQEAKAPWPRPTMK